MWLLISTAIAGFTMAVIVAVFSDRGNNPAARLARCFTGFFVAIVWIMAIADEVVNVLKVCQTLAFDTSIETTAFVDIWLYLRSF